MKCKPCKYLLAGIIVLILLLVVIFLFILPGESEDICVDITDTSQRSDCYNQLAKDTGKIEYCKEVSYYYDVCINQADVNREASISEVESVCDQISDSSRRESCYEYANEYYS